MKNCVHIKVLTRDSVCALTLSLQTHIFDWTYLTQTREANGRSLHRRSPRREVLGGRAYGFLCTPLCGWFFPSSQARISDRGRLLFLAVGGSQVAKRNRANITSFPKRRLIIGFVPIKAELAERLLELHHVQSWHDKSLQSAFLRIGRI